jgi:hypothetical protein
MIGSVPSAKERRRIPLSYPTAVKGIRGTIRNERERKNSKAGAIRVSGVGRGVAGSMRNFTALMTPEGRDSVPEAHLCLVLSILQR